MFTTRKTAWRKDALQVYRYSHYAMCRYTNSRTLSSWRPDTQAGKEYAWLERNRYWIKFHLDRDHIGRARMWAWLANRSADRLLRSLHAMQANTT